jgi:hypothetical protein
MRLVKQEYAVFDFEELGEEARQKAIDSHRNFLQGVIDLDCETGEFKRLLEMYGFSDVKVYYSGFWSQGDGASFTGRYRYKAGALKAIKAEFTGTWFMDVIEYLGLLDGINKKCFYSLQYAIDSNSRYCHANTMQVNSLEDCRGDRDFSKHEDDITEYVRGIANEFYYLLEKSYNSQFTDEAVIESLECNEYEFYENGEMI